MLVLLDFEVKTKLTKECTLLFKQCIKKFSFLFEFLLEIHVIEKRGKCKGFFLI